MKGTNEAHLEVLFTRTLQTNKFAMIDGEFKQLVYVFDESTKEWRPEWWKMNCEYV